MKLKNNNICRSPCIKRPTRMLNNNVYAFECYTPSASFKQLTQDVIYSFSIELPPGWEKVEDPKYGTYYIE